MCEPNTNASRHPAASRGGGTGGQVSIGGGRARGHFGDQGDGRIDGQVDQVGGQGSEVIDGVNKVPDFSTIISQQLQNLLPTIIAQVGDQGRGQGNGRNQNDDAINDNIQGMVVATEPKTIQKAVQIAGTLTDEALRNGSIKKNHEKKGNAREPSKDRNVRDENNKTMTGNAFSKTANPIREGYTGTDPKCTTCNYHHLPEAPCRACFNCNHRGHFTKDCRVVLRNVNPINARNLIVRTCYECGSANHIKIQGNQARGRAFMLGAEEAREDPNIVTGIEPSDLGFSYEIEIASRQLLEINKVIHGCKLDIKGHMFDINLIPFGSGSFDVIIGMYWLSNHKDEIICHEKVLRIPLLDGKVLRVLGEKPKEKVRQLMNAMTKEHKQEEIVIVRDFLEFLGHVINKEGIHVYLSKIEAVKNWKAPRTLFEVCSFLELAGYCRRIIEDFSMISKPLTVLNLKTLPDGSKDFMVYCYASGLGLGCVLMQRRKVIAYASSKKTLNMRQRRWIELFSDYDCEIRYHLGKANVVADVLSRKERVKPKRKGLDEMIKLRNDGALYYLDRMWVPLKGDVRTLIIDEAHKSKYSGHPGSDKIYYDVRDRLDMSMAYHPQTDGQSERTIQNLEDMLRACVLDFGGSWDVHLLLIEFSYNNSYHSSVRCAPLRLKAACDHHKSYTDKRRKPLEFSLGDYVLLKVSPWKCVVRFIKKGKLAPRFVGPFEIIENVGLVAYQLDLLEELNGVHDMFHVSNLKKCLADPTL
nr:putative reverse transcriptase domain-containing protein [Tanacetum cinerariifolium]